MNSENHKTYPQKLGLSEGPDKDHYAQQAQCRNCNYHAWWISIPKGITVDAYRRTLTCPKCEITGMWVIY